MSHSNCTHPSFKKGVTINYLSPRGVLVNLLPRNNNGPLLAGVAKHLLGLEHLTLLKDHGPDALCRGGSGVEDLLDAVDERDRDLRRVVVGAPLDQELTRRVRFLGLPRVALGQELHARRRAWVQCVEFDSDLRQELQHSLSLSPLTSLCSCLGSEQIPIIQFELEYVLKKTR